MDFFRKHKVFYNLKRLITLRNYVLVTICYSIFFFLVLEQNNNDSEFTVSPFEFLLKMFTPNLSAINLIVGNTVLFLTLFLSIINVIYFFRNKKVNKAVLAGT